MLIKITGIVLIVFGIIMLVYTGFNYVTTEKVVDVGPIKITKEKNHFVKWPPIAGAIFIIGGIAIHASSKKITPQN
jgi:hypothetical protein